MTARATWNGALLAASDETIIVEGNHYFPPTAITREYFRDSDTHTICPWKGEASYSSVEVDGKTNPDAAWFYPEPYEAAGVIKDYVAFWRDVEITADASDGVPGPNPPPR